METTLLIILVIVLLILALLIYFILIYRKSGKKKILYFPSFPHINYDSTQILLWKKPDATPGEFKKYIADNFPGAKTSDIKNCGDCDDSLVLITNIDANLFLAGQAPTPDPSKKPEPKLSGHDGPAYYSPNFPMIFKDKIHANPKRESYNKNPHRKSDTQDNLRKVTVAVFDTGIDTTLINVPLYQNNASSCLGAGADTGWNFAGQNANWNDKQEDHHGTIVAKLIADEASEWGNNPINILPVKVFGDDGSCLLSNVLCALQYAKNRGADIINASFGFYAPIALTEKDQGAAVTLLFKSFLTHYFENSSILMMAAAGNLDDVNEGFVYESNDPKAKRNLDNVSFYPASFARTIPNILAVTTISTNENNVSPHQNFSPHVVDIGVKADRVESDYANNDPDLYLFFHPYFFHPYINNGATIEGSSFATPLATGKIAANYYLIEDLLPSMNKAAIKERLAENGIVNLHVAPFDVLIKDGTIMNR